MTRYPARDDIPLLCRTGVPQYIEQDRALAFPAVCVDGVLVQLVWLYYPSGPLESVTLWTMEPWASASSLISIGAWEPVAPDVFERVWAGGVMLHGTPYPERS